jgi:DNA-directed RNA polymerase specialized sigma24 family protein
MKAKDKKKFEEMYDVIDEVIKKRKNKWKLKAINWFDFEDIEQIIKLHIYKKWALWDQSRPIGPWINRIVTNKIRNIIRNNYTAFARPCLSCSFNQNKNGEFGNDNSCGYTSSKTQCSECPLYAKWEKLKKPAYNVKITVSLENHQNYHSNFESSKEYDYKNAEKKLHDIMKENLTDKQFFIYKMFFIDNLSDDQIAKILKFKTNEKGRKAGYKQIKNLKKMLYLKAKVVLKDNDIFTD